MFRYTQHDKAYLTAAYWENEIVPSRVSLPACFTCHAERSVGPRYSLLACHPEGRVGSHYSSQPSKFFNSAEVSLSSKWPAYDPATSPFQRDSGKLRVRDQAHAVL